MLPTYKQIRCYWLVLQDDRDLPCAMFLLECDAKEWVEQQKNKEVYSVKSPMHY